MLYALTRTVFEERIRLPVSDGRAEAIQAAANGELGSLGIEEKYNLLLENFEEFEAELLTNALHRSLFQPGEWSSTIGELHRLNRRLVNLLATARLYVDQVPHSLSSLFGTGSEIATDFAAWKSREYDSHVGYRVMDAMRNYMQHRSLPLHAIKHHTTTRDVATDDLSEHIVVAEIDPQVYREDGKFKAEILAELEALGNKIEIPPFVRQYVACLSRIHTDLRKRLVPFVSEWDETIRSCAADFMAAGGSDPSGLALVSLTGERTYEVVTHISPGPIVRRQELERRNRNVEHYERVLVASRRTA